MLPYKITKNKRIIVSKTNIKVTGSINKRKHDNMMYTLHCTLINPPLRASVAPSCLQRSHAQNDRE